MTYVVIAADGALSIRDGSADLSEVGPEGPVRVTLAPEYRAAGWVNDMGHRRPEIYPRNIVGSCVLAVLGAARYPYAGPVVVTGWDLASTPTEVISLGPTVRLLTAVHEAVSSALDLTENPGPVTPARWAEHIRALADYVRAAPTPQITVHRL